MAELALEQTLDLSDYLAAFKRRRVLFAVVAGMIFLAGLVTAYVWPPTYEASSTILIEEQEIPTDLVRTTVTSYAAQRIQVISQQVMSRSNLMDIIEKYELFERERRLDTTEKVLHKMRNNINIEMITAEVVDPRSGRPTSATIAFKLGFASDNPLQALEVTNELTTLYLDENLKSRTEKAAETYDFLTVEANRLSDEITRLEQALATFKETNSDTLPELRDLNAKILERTEMEIDNIDTQIRGLKERKIYLGAQIALIEPYGSDDVMGPSARLDALRTEYIRLASRYSPDHPDVTSVKREIKALEMETGKTASADDLEEQLRILRVQLATAKENYTQEHPDVRSLQRQIATLEEDLEHVRSRPVTASVYSNPDNPAYVSLDTQLTTTDIEIRSLKEKRARLVAKVAEFENRLMQTPKSEQRFRALARDLQNSTRRYQEIRGKQMTAEVAQEMEKERKGEKFTLIDPAVLPEEPISPNRPAIMFLSLVLAMGAGLGSAALRETLDNAIRGTKSLVAIVHTAPLAVIPYLSSEEENNRQKRKWGYLIIVVIAIIIILPLLVHFLVTPLDVIWFKGLRKVNLLIGK